MGVEFDRILEPLSGRYERVTELNVKPPQGRIAGAARPAGYRFDRRVNDAVVAVNRLLDAGEEVSATASAFHVRARASTRAGLERLARDLGVSFDGVPSLPAARPIRRARVGLWDQHGGSMTSGWTRWILEQFAFQYAVVYPPDLDAGGLRARYDVLVFPDGAIGSGPGGPGGAGASAPTDLPEEYRGRLGRVTVERTVPQLRQFVEQGGTVVAIGESAAALGTHLGLPLDDHLVEGSTPLPRAKYFVPGSLLRARVDTTQDAAAGMRDQADVFFDNSPVFRLRPGAAGVRRIAWFDTATPLRSGWAWGQRYLEGGIVAAEVGLGSGRVFLYGPEILHRAQPHATFKLLFNAILTAATPDRKLEPR
jgi:hypothetical protein